MICLLRKGICAPAVVGVWILVACVHRSSVHALGLLEDSEENSPTSLSSEQSAPAQELVGWWPKWDSCYSHTNCEDCYKAYLCHWCSGSCHAKASVRGGCIDGDSCTPSDSKTCSDHQTCTDCTSSSWGCHWCQGKESCHEIGSTSGCVKGANCYAIDRCQRIEPEKLSQHGVFSSSSFSGVGPVAKGVLGVLLGLIICCSTLCFGAATFVRGAVKDLIGDPDIVEDDNLLRFSGEEEIEFDGGRDRLEMPLMDQSKHGSEAQKDENNACRPLVDEKDDEHEIAVRNASKLTAMTNDQGSAALSRDTRRQQRPSSVHQMYRGCQFCYIFTVLSSTILFVMGMAYAPREPQYNVCTNEIAWKDIVEGLASLKMSANFDLLMSVYNPNRFEVDLSTGSGQFHHDGQYVGSFDIPEGVISELSISDIVVKVSFSPDKWSALSLTSEYYRGKLALTVGGHTHVKIPGLNYQFDAKFQDIEVNVNDPSLDDTHLCACPGWKKPVAISAS